MTHALKTDTEFFDKISAQRKNFELRKMDRPFMNGDKLLLQEFTGLYTGRELELVITDVFHGDQAEKFGLKKGFGIISFSEYAQPVLAPLPYLPNDCGSEIPVSLRFDECKPSPLMEHINNGLDPIQKEINVHVEPKF